MNNLKHLTDRDFKILETIDSYGLLSTSQVRKLFFSHASKRTMLKRLQILNEKGFVRPVTGLSRGERAWCITKRSSLLLGSQGFIKTVNKNTLYHDIKINDLRLSLDDTGYSSHWTNGHSLLSRASAETNPYDRDETVIPDSLFLLNTRQGIKSVALELELSKKAKYRYTRVFRKYFLKKEVHWLWYVVPTKKFGDHLLSMQPTQKFESGYDKFRWSLMDEVLTNPKDTKVHSISGVVTLSEICAPQKFKMRGPTAPHAMRT
jgi:hypothetical protein